MKLCVFQGTFNPIHNAHILVAKFIKENFDFDKLLFIPAYIPPHKTLDKTFAFHRYKMVEKAIKDEHSFDISDIEYKKEQKSYTYLTILQLYKMYEIEDKINFIIGTDAFKKIESWYEIDKLKKLVKFIVSARENDFDKNDLEYFKTQGFDFEITNLDFLDISSTSIREKIKNNEDISELVPIKVLEYINDNKLYRN